MGGRLGYGDVLVIGKGGVAAAERFLTISNPNQFRDRLMGAMSHAAPSEQPAGAAPATADPLAVLARLAELRDTGAVTSDEFEAKKAEILARV
ncbi:MAG: SHOCT domain-containing protein [Chloroflexi bacterium]|nr:SHOCT domain-containing protein [Chloroflexota bacterium]